MLPILGETSDNTKKYVVRFRGLNMSEEYIDGEFSHTENMSSVISPCLTQRFGRVLLDGQYENPEGMIAKGGLLVVSDGTVKYEGEKVGEVAPGRKQLASVGNYILIFPDKVYYDVATKKFGEMEATFNGSVTIKDGDTVEGSGFSFQTGDGLEISGCGATENNKTIVVKEATEGQLTFAANSFTNGTWENVTIKRAIPDMDVICEHNYRLWGAKGNKIYASEYLNPLNFNVFNGLAGDSYAMDVGTDGEFTGCIPYSSHICFFKENTLHKMYGTKPSNFQVVTSQVYGVQAGSERSLRIVNETLYYKGVNGVYAYTGGVPELISPAFGTKRFSDACATSDGERYYISMRNGTKWGLFVYDIKRGIWLREDNTHCVDMDFFDGHAYMLCRDGRLYRIDPAVREKDVEWSATFCPFAETINERKVYSRFHLRLELSEGAWLSVEMRRDNAPKWQRVYTTHNERARTISIPVIPERCDSVEIRLSGKGGCVLRTFIREFQTGSDVG